MQLKFKQKNKESLHLHSSFQPIKINALIQLKFKQKIKSLFTFNPHSKSISNKMSF